MKSRKPFVIHAEQHGSSGKTLRLKRPDTQQAVEAAIALHGMVQWAGVKDPKGHIAFSYFALRRIWHYLEQMKTSSAQLGCDVRYAWLNPEHICQIPCSSVGEAIQCAIQRVDYDDAYWAEVRTVSGEVLVDRETIQKLHYSDMRARGYVIHEYIVRVGGDTPLLGDWTYLGQVA